MDNVHKLVGGLHKTPLLRALPLKRPKAADLGLDAFLTYRTHTHRHTRARTHREIPQTKTFTINLTIT